MSDTFGLGLDIADDHRPYSDEEYERGQFSIPANHIYVPGQEQFNVDGRRGDDYDDPDKLRIGVTTPVARDGIPIIGTTPYPAILVDARTITMLTGDAQTIGYRGGAPDPGHSLALLRYGDANTTAIVEILGQGMGSSAMLGFCLPSDVLITLPLSTVQIRCSLQGSAPVRVGILVYANERSPQ